MMSSYLVIKVIHIISSTILFGTGLGIAFFMLRSHFTDDIKIKYYLAKTTVLADLLFTTPAVIIQPLTGAWLIWKLGYPWDSTWLLITYCLYILAGACWLPVVWIQIELRNILKQSIDENTPIPERYFKLFKLWFILGWPAFISLVIIFYLMVSKPI